MWLSIYCVVNYFKRLLLMPKKKSLILWRFIDLLNWNEEIYQEIVTHFVGLF